MPVVARIGDDSASILDRMLRGSYRRSSLRKSQLVGHGSPDDGFEGGMCGPQLEGKGPAEPNVRLTPCLFHESSF
jgi:hypothetical protein